MRFLRKIEKKLRNRLNFCSMLTGIIPHGVRKCRSKSIEKVLDYNWSYLCSKNQTSGVCKLSSDYTGTQK